MALNDAALVVAANAISSAVTHAQAYSAATDATGTTNAVGSRVTMGKSVDADGDITFTAAFTGLTGGQAVPFIGYFSAATGGTFYGVGPNSTGDANANSAGAITITVVETSTAS